MTAMLVIILVVLIMATILAIGDWASNDDRPSDTRIALRVLIGISLCMAIGLTGRVLWEVYPNRDMPSPGLCVKVTAEKAP